MRGAIWVALWLAACAAPRSAFPPIANMHSPTLCYIEYAGNALEQQAARAELTARRFQCTPQATQEGRWQWERMAGEQHQLTMQERSNARRGADAALGLGLILMTPAPSTYSPPVVCRTTGYTTVCN